MNSTQHNASLIAAIRGETSALHQRLDQLVMNSDPFANLDHYSRYLRMQYAFQCGIECLYQEPTLGAVFPDLPLRSRLFLVKQDLADLGVSEPSDDCKDLFPSAIDLPTATGWLYVSEGSRLGAAILFRQAAVLGLNENFGARHLAASQGGPGEKWREFTHAVSAIPFTHVETEWAKACAVAAFEYVIQLAQK
jgi:heme oxygenase